MMGFSHLDSESEWEHYQRQLSGNAPVETRQIPGRLDPRRALQRPQWPLYYLRNLLERRQER
jgi:hypothetical protein